MQTKTLYIPLNYNFWINKEGMKVIINAHLSSCVVIALHCSLSQFKFVSQLKLTDNDRLYGSLSLSQQLFSRDAN